MWNDFKRWCTKNSFEITWFIIGWCSFATLDNIADGYYLWATFNAFLVWANFKLRNVL
jgi:hypothetical protein